jgi:prepilin-type N-terminal cleavage/methylation domain-containing protein
MRKSGFTLIELMVAMVVGLTAITSVYSLGSAMSRQFYEEQRVATAQGTSRAAIMELRKEISRAGLFGSPNGSLESTCDTTPPTLPKLGGGTYPLGAFQYYPDQDLSVLDPGSLNTSSDVHADRLRVLTSLYLTDQLLVHSASVAGDVIVLQTGNQAYRRTFSWGQAAGPFTSGSAPTYLTGALDWDSAWSGESASWKGIAQKGARAFQTGSVLHIETPEGRHFFRSVFSKQGNTQDEIRIGLDTADPLPVGTACLPGAAEGATIAPLQWIEYAIVDPFDSSEVGADFMDFEGMFYIDLDPTNPAFALKDGGASEFEAPNRVLVRRALDSSTGNVKLNSTQVVAEFVSSFRVKFLLDTNSGEATPSISANPVYGSSGAVAVNANPEQVRAVVIELGIRSPIEDPTIDYAAIGDAGTRFDVDDGKQGAARVRLMRIEIPVMNVARRNLK